MTFNCCNSLKLLISASDMPSDKYSVSVLWVAFSKGNTTMLLSGFGDVTADVFAFSRCQKRKLPKTMTMRAEINAHFGMAGFALAVVPVVLNFSGTSRLPAS